MNGLCTCFSLALAAQGQMNSTCFYWTVPTVAPWLLAEPRETASAPKPRLVLRSAEWTLGRPEGAMEGLAW